MKIARSAEDLGIESCGAARRVTRSMLGRVAKVFRRSLRVRILAKQNVTARRLYGSGVQPQQCYGHQIIGISPVIEKAMRRNMAVGSGMSSVGTCPVTVCHWAFTQSKDPGVLWPVDQCKSWIEAWEAAEPSFRIRMARQWLQFATMLKALPNQRRWRRVRGLMSTTMATLLDLEILTAPDEAPVAAEQVRVVMGL